jgi:crossover junction endodeoxyribonuclease RuvC
MGFGVLGISGNTTEVLSIGVMKLAKLSSHYSRLEKIYSRISSLISEFAISEMAIEAPFYGNNVQSMLKLGRAQGVCIAAAMAAQVPVTEYAPLKVKMSVTGVGRASKQQVADMLERLLHFKTSEKYLDATDALAVAFCHFNNSRIIVKSAGYKSWGDFVNKNPDRAK